MLLTCNECKGQVSDKALTCPHCGNPLKHNARQPATHKHPRLPNGFGQITKLKNRNLRNPYRVMVKVGTNEHGRPIAKLLKPKAYFKTYNDAYAALVAYNQNPFDLTKQKTLLDLYTDWFSEHSKSITPQTAKSIKIAWKYCEPLYNVIVRECKVYDIKTCMESSPATPCTKNRMKQVLNMVFDYAKLYDITDKNPARAYILDVDTQKEISTVKNEHIIYDDTELHTLWDNVDMEDVDILLINIYTGWRPGELLKLCIEDINLDEQYITGGSKTEAGRNRIVPIHPIILSFIQKRVGLAKALGTHYLFTDKHGKQLTYMKYSRSLDRLLYTLNLNKAHRPHDSRKTFVSLAKNSGVDEYAIKRLIGHHISDLTEKTYTTRTIEWLRTELCKISKYYENS